VPAPGACTRALREEPAASSAWVTVCCQSILAKAHTDQGMSLGLAKGSQPRIPPSSSLLGRSDGGAQCRSDVYGVETRRLYSMRWVKPSPERHNVLPPAEGDPDCLTPGRRRFASARQGRSHERGISVRHAGRGQATTLGGVMVLEVERGARARQGESRLDREATR
jgi:hypothetical protein